MKSEDRINHLRQNRKYSGMTFKTYLTFILVSLQFLLYSQQTKGQYVITGKVTDNKGIPLEMVNIVIKDAKQGTTSEKDGSFKIRTDIDHNVLLFSSLGFTTQEVIIQKKLLRQSTYADPVDIHVVMEPTEELIDDVNVTDKRSRQQNLMRVNPKTVQNLPDASGDFISAAIKTLPGVSSANELSSQYNVRGGNFDENLVYVNDIEIYRPFLIRAGQQEGLSFVNGDMVSSVLFSAGGYEAKYGDKMSSVLDIKYRKPTGFSSAFSASMLGGSAHVEGISKNNRFTHTTGLRYKTSKYVLNTLETEGDYTPTFFDVQSYLTYDVSDVFEISLLGNIARNSFQFVPQTRRSSFGTYNSAVDVAFYFNGQEIDNFNTYMGALAGDYHPTKNLKLKFITSGFMTNEQETFDIEGTYFLNDLDESIGESTGDSTMNIGLGNYLDHARNTLDARVLSFAHKGFHTTEKNQFQWGLKVRNENIDDKINEWQLLDSAGYSVPYHGDSVILSESLNAENKISSNRFTAYIQDTYTFERAKNEFSVTGGLRAGYWTFNDEFIFSPRFSVSFKPHWRRDFVFRFASGVYYQSPFYKELRDFEGNLNENIKSQRSIHYVLGSDYNFKAWGRPFKFVSEIYYKQLTNIIPYLVDNVRIRYYARDKATGYVAGLDMKINGEFVEGVDSWLSLSFMQTEEDIIGDGHGYIPRPMDQRFNAGLFFQDYIPGKEKYKMHLMLLYGSPLPFGPPDKGRHMATARMPSYKRVDLGFSMLLKSKSDQLPESHFLNLFESLWLGFEVFNLLDVRNTVSYTWITVVPNTTVLQGQDFHQFAVPNKLTSRRLNLRLTAKF